MPAPSLIRYDVRARPSGTSARTVLVLHGGQEHSAEPVTGRSLSLRRAQALALAIRRKAHAQGVGLWVLRYRTVGWNGDGHDRIQDARWALDRIRAEHGEAPVALVGHSMGARTACRVADHDLVRGVVALAPWLPADDPVEALTGRVLHAAHGRRDEITSPAQTEAYVARAEAVAAEATYTDMGDVGHYLLRGARAWHAFALDRAMEILAR